MGRMVTTTCWEPVLANTFSATAQDGGRAVGRGRGVGIPLGVTLGRGLPVAVGIALGVAVEAGIGDGLSVNVGRRGSSSCLNAEFVFESIARERKVLSPLTC